ncbi:hypothetical protein T484DRAFT_1808372 [Baffinella frigidus]|nr:hypothetical protein T484DRAFT_1808372 [Cryptophyta sp. CCMP2293]
MYETASPPGAVWGSLIVDCLCNWNDALQRHAAKRNAAGDRAGAYSLYQAATARLEEVVKKQPFECDGLAQKSAAECAGCGGSLGEEEAGLVAACVTYRRALVTNAAHPETLAGLGETLVDLGRLQQYNAQMKQGRREEAAAALTSYIAQMKQGRREEAAAALTSAGEVYFRFLQIDPTDTVGLCNMACACLMHKNKPPFVGLYNMACACALLGRSPECNDYLTRTATAEHAAGADMAEWARLP